MADRPIFGAIADPTRRAILGHLLDGPMPIARIAERFPVSRTAVRKHLRVLEEAGLVRSEVAGRERVFRADPAPLGEVEAWAARCRLAWAARLANLKHAAESMSGEPSQVPPGDAT